MVQAEESKDVERLRKEVEELHRLNEKLLAIPSGKVPTWCIDPGKSPSKSPGVPTLFLSDWHWGEVVDPKQVHGCNEYNVKLAEKRAKSVLEHAIELLTKHMVKPDYPGIVVALGGDMVSGSIHEDLLATNEMPPIEAVTHLHGVMVAFLEQMANVFGNVFVPCVTGNHGRSTLKMRSKDRHHTSFDWILYKFLQEHFSKDKRIDFLVAEGPNAYYSVFGRRYLLSHGDAYRGGDGVIGIIGPLIRGDYRTRALYGQIEMPYDTLAVGHFHQLIQTQKIIVNGSLVGYSEYALSRPLPFEEPKQALWITHPSHGLTFSMPVLAERGKVISREWVSWKT
jgi:hypothetical protein